MAKYLIRGKFTSEGLRGIRHEGGTARREAVEKTVASVGGSLDRFYFAFGDADTFVVVDVPTPEAAAAVALAVGSTDAVSMTTTALLTPEQIDDARNLVPDYRPPGG